MKMKQRRPIQTDRRGHPMIMSVKVLPLHLKKQTQANSMKLRVDTLTLMGQSLILSRKSIKDPLTILDIVLKFMTTVYQDKFTLTRKICNWLPEKIQTMMHMAILRVTQP